MKNDYIDNRDAEDDARSYEIDRIENSEAMTDTLPTLSSEEVEAIEKEANELYPHSPYGREVFSAGVTLEKRRAKAEREELLKAARDVVDKHNNPTNASDPAGQNQWYREMDDKIETLEAAITKCIGNL